MRKSIAQLLLSAALAAMPPQSVEAEALTAEEGKIRTIARSIGQPAQRAMIESWLDRGDEDPPTTAGLVALALGRCGGHDAIEGLLALEKRHKGRIVGSMLLATAGLGLRWPRLEQPAVRTLLYSRDVDLRILALQTLGRIGDGRHMPLLLDGAASTDQRTKVAALLAMRLLSGIKLPDRLDRWELWWRQAERRGQRDLHLALGRLEADPSGPTALLWRGVAKRTAWIDIEHARLTAAGWLEGTDDRLHVEAALLIGHLGLADLGRRAEQAMRVTRSETARAVIRGTLATLGYIPLRRTGPVKGAAGLLPTGR